MDNQQQQQSNGSSQYNQKSTQAYKLFSEGYKPVEVAIQLGLPEKQATRYCREYWELKGLHELTLLYEERKDHLPSFIRLHNITNELTKELFSDEFRKGDAARPVGEGKYAIVKHQNHAELAYILEMPKEPGEAQRELGIEKEASYIVS